MFHIWSRKRRIWVELTKRNEWGVNKPQDEIPTWNCSYRLGANFVEKKIFATEKCVAYLHIWIISCIGGSSIMRLIFVIYAPKRQMADKCAIASAECESRWRRVHFIELKFGRTRGAEFKFFFLSKSPLDSLEFPKINQTLHSWRQIQIFTLLNFRWPRSSHWINFFFFF